MTTDICTENVIVQITSPPETNNDVSLPVRANQGSNCELGRQLLLAAKNGDTNLVLGLMAGGAPFSSDWLGTTALHLAAAGGHVGTAAVLLRAGGVRNARTKVERTPLHVAAAGGHAAVVELLLQHGADPHARDMLRMSALHWAARGGHTAAATALLAAGADPAPRDKFGLTAAALAARHGHAALAAALAAHQPRKPTKPLTPSTYQTAFKYQDVTVVPEAKKIKLEGIRIKPEPVLEMDSDAEQETEAGASTGEPSGTAPGAAPGTAAGAALLAAHGITLLPRDRDHTVLRALRHGRKLVLSDAGKLLLKESAAAAAPSSPATPINSNVADTQVKYIQVPKDSKSSSPGKEAASKSKPRPLLLNVRPVTYQKKGAQKQPVKIIMNKANFKKLISNNNTVTANSHEGVAGGPEGEGEASLRAALAAARADVARLTRELAAARAQLAAREGGV